MHSKVFVVCSLFCASSLGQVAIDPASHEQGLSYVVSQRIGFNRILGAPFPALTREYGITKDQFAKMRVLCRERFEGCQRDIAELGEDWSKLDAEVRRERIQELVKRDDDRITEQLAVIDEMLTPVQQFALFREYLRAPSVQLLFDPMVSRYLKLESHEVEQMQEQHLASLKILTEGRKIVPNNFVAMDGDFDEKFLSARARVWSKLPEEKIVRCFQVLGYINQDQDLVDYVEYYPEETKELAAEVEVFRIAELRLAADKKSGKR